MVDTEGVVVPHVGERKRQFEARWLSEATVNEIVCTAWERASLPGGGSTLMQKTRQVHEDLHTWDREVLKAPVRRLKKLKKELEKVRRSPMTNENLARQKELLLNIELLLEQEEIYWVQRARANWLKHGDRNSGFFPESCN